MHKIILAAILVLCSTTLGLAQNKDKPEVFAGFSIDSIDTGLANSGIQNTGNRETARL